MYLCEELVMDIFTQFILEHEQDDTGRLLLGREKWPGIDMDLAVHTIEGRRRMRVKVPAWHAVPSLLYPTRLCTEQCSSAATARYKAALAARILSGKTEMPATAASPTALPGGVEAPEGAIADLTGGLGVDAWAFSQVAGQVLHNEMDPLLSEAVCHNFAQLGVSNTTFRTECAASGQIGAILGGFRPDLIFLDPARRAGDGRKVFRIEDCRPDVLSLKEELLRHAPHLLLKISPMADIGRVVGQLHEASGPGRVREVHIVEAGGECKELLLWIDRGWTGPYRIFVCHAGQHGAASADAGNADASPSVEKAEESPWQEALAFDPEAERRAVPQFVPGPGAMVGGLLFEPGKALSKAGVFHTLADGTGLLKLSRHTHLYFVSPAAFPSACRSASPFGPAPRSGTGANQGKKAATELLRFGKLFGIKEVHPFSGKTAKAVGKAWPRADVTVRDLPLSSDELRQRMGVVSDASVHIFGCRVVSPAADDGQGRSGSIRTTKDGAPRDSACLLVTEPVDPVFIQTSGVPVPPDA